MAAHYGTSILPARVRRPRDKAKVENGVPIVERFILARLRNRQFFSLEELNQAIRELLDELNARLMCKLGASRRAFFEALDRPALKALPDEPYQYAEWKKCRVVPDYHVDLHGHLYSVPHALIREVLEARMTGTTVEQFHRGKRVASHARSALRNRHTTIAEHMPSSHRRYAEWTPARIAREAERIGPATAGLCAAIMRTRPQPEQGFRACLGILRLVKSYGGERLRGSLPARSRHRRHDLRLDRLDPEERPRPGLSRGRRRRALSDPPRQYPRRRILPLTRKHDAQSPDP